VLYLNLTGLGPINGGTQVASACNSYQWQGQTFSQTGMYSDTIQTASGCDSIIHLNLTIHNSVTGATTQVSECSSYDWNGQVYTQSGTYTFNGSTQFGCDSIATLILTINQGPTNTTLVNNAGQLTASSQNAVSYSWLDCSSNSLIPGETGVTFSPTSPGSFAVIASNNCGADTSACVEVEVQGLNEFNVNDVIVYPNPTNGLITVNTNKSTIESIEILDINGKSILNKRFDDNVIQLDLSEYSVGVYLLKVYSSENEPTLHRIVKSTY
jgi:hypothetical protein